MLKKVLALALAGAMVIGSMSMGAFASDMVDPSYDQSITVSGLEKNDTVNFYQILEWKGNEGAYAGWSLKAPFDAFANNYTADANHSAEWYAIRALVGDPTASPAVKFALTSEIAGKLADLATSGAIASTSHDDTSHTLDLASEDTTKLGLYMALITAADAKNVYNPVFVSADFNTTNTTSSQAAIPTSTYSDSSAAKKGTMIVTKTDELGSKSYDQTWRSTRIGEIVSYTVDTVIPGYGNVYQNPHYVVKDQLTDLKLVDDPEIVLVKPVDLIKGEGVANEDAEDADYFIEKAADGKSYTITFTKKYLKTVKAPTDVQITYSAEVTSTAPMNVNTEENEVWVEFSHNPQQEDDYDYVKDDTNHYTYTIDANILGGGKDMIGKSGNELIKVGVDAEGNPIKSTVGQWSEITEGAGFKSPLEGATFKLYKDYDESTKTGTEYTKADGSPITGLVSDSGGRITITGLDAGTYYLVEDKAPNGFIKDLKPVKIEILPEFIMKHVVMYTDGNEWVYEKDETHKDKVEYDLEVLKTVRIKVNNKNVTTHTFYNEGPVKSLTWIEASSSEAPSSIVNTKGVELPSTGGIGTTIFYCGGAVLVLLAGVLLVSKRRIA